MKKQQLSLIIALCSIGVAVLVIFIGVFLSLPHFDKSEPIIFERVSNGKYSSVVYEEREYLPFAPCSPRERTAYLGYVGEDEADEIYSYKDYNTDEWLVSYLNSGMMADCMLLKEKNTTNIPDGLSSEYEWWLADLSQITFDGKTIGDTLEQTELAKYTPKTNLPSGYSHNYEEWRLTIADDKITEIMATFGEIEISINGKTNFTTIDDIISDLGWNYQSSWYDREQGLEQIEYTDEDNHLRAAFIYNKNSNQLVWLIYRRSE